MSLSDADRFSLHTITRLECTRRQLLTISCTPLMPQEENRSHRTPTKCIPYHLDSFDSMPDAPAQTVVAPTPV